MNVAKWKWWTDFDIICIFLVLHLMLFYMFLGVGAFQPISSFCWCIKLLLLLQSLSNPFYPHHQQNWINIASKHDIQTVIDSGIFPAVNGIWTHWLCISKYGIVLMHHSLLYYLLMIIRSILIFFITITLTMIFHLHFLLLYKEWL